MLISRPRVWGAVHRSGEDSRSHARDPGAAQPRPGRHRRPDDIRGRVGCSPTTFVNSRRARMYPVLSIGEPRRREASSDVTSTARCRRSRMKRWRGCCTESTSSSRSGVKTPKGVPSCPGKPCAKRLRTRSPTVTTVPATTCACTSSRTASRSPAPAACPEGMNEADLGTKSVPRNPLLYGMLVRMGLVGGIGSGIRRMKSLCREYGVEEPRIEVSGSKVTTTFLQAPPPAIQLQPSTIDDDEFADIQDSLFAIQDIEAGGPEGPVDEGDDTRWQATPYRYHTGLIQVWWSGRPRSRCVSW